MGCRLDSHPDRAEIDQVYIKGASLRQISARYNCSLGTAHRHKQCIKEALRDAMSSEQGELREHGSDLLQRVHELADEAIGILETAKANGNLKAATSAICAAVRVLELTGRLDGSLAQPNAPGLHLTLNQRVTNVRVNLYDNDVDFARLIAEATDNFNPTEIQRLKSIADSGSVITACNAPPKALIL
jgi:hypothetical protein